MEKTIEKAHLLLLDKLSYASFGQEESEFPFKVIVEHSNLANTIITINLEFSQYPEMFTNETLVATLVAPLTYHSHVFEHERCIFRFDSYYMS